MKDHVVSSDRVFRTSQAAKLDSADRLVWLPPHEVLEPLGLEPGMSVADIGAGTGHYSLPIARRVGPEGKVYAVDLQPEMLAILSGKLAATELGNVEMVAGQALCTTLPNATCELALLANVWHELDDLHGVLSECRRILRPNGRIAILDWRTNVPRPPGPPLEHRRPVEEVVEMLISSRWNYVTQVQAGWYSYLVIGAK